LEGADGIRRTNARAFAVAPSCRTNAARFGHRGRAYFPISNDPGLAGRWKQGDFPFLCVQLAPFKKIEGKPTESGLAELREAAANDGEKVAQVGMAVITDVAKKTTSIEEEEPVGARLGAAGPEDRLWQNIVAVGRFTRRFGRGQSSGAELRQRRRRAWNAAAKLTGFHRRRAGPHVSYGDAEIRGDTVIVSCPLSSGPCRAVWLGELSGPSPLE